MKRRGFLAALVAAPAVVHAESLMPVVNRGLRWRLFNGWLQPSGNVECVLVREGIGECYDTISATLVDGHFLAKPAWTAVLGNAVKDIIVVTPQGRVIADSSRLLPFSRMAGLPCVPNGGDLIMDWERPLADMAVADFMRSQQRGEQVRL